MLLNVLTNASEYRLFTLCKLQVNRSSNKDILVSGVSQRTSKWAKWWQFPGNEVFVFFLNPNLRTYLAILERGEGRKRNITVREKHLLLASPMCPDQGLNPQPRHVPRADTEPATFQFMAQCTNQVSHTGHGMGTKFLWDSNSLVVARLLVADCWLSNYHRAGETGIGIG